MVKAFQINGNINTHYIIFDIINIYNTEINNLNIKLMIQWDLFLSFNSMIQQINYAKKKQAN